jgi:fructose-bisphosphate aldolase class II
MPLVPLPDLLAAARAERYAVGYFEAWDGYSLEAVVEAAEAEQAPVVIGFGCLLVDSAWLDRGGIEALGALGRAGAERARVPVALLLNEARTSAQAIRGVEAGFNAVMMTSAEQDPPKRASDVAELVRFAHARGVAVEGEIGILPDAGQGALDAAEAGVTDPDEAAAFVAATGVDCLAVSFGNVHLLEGRPAPIDLDRLEAIHHSTSVPLVAHGGTSFPADAVAPAIARGVAKFNVGTALKRAFLSGLTDGVAALQDPVSAAVHQAIGSHSRQDVLVQARARIVPVVRELIQLYGGSGRGARP